MVRVFLLEINPSIKVKMTRAIRITIKASRGLSLKRQVKSVIITRKMVILLRIVIRERDKIRGKSKMREM